MACPYAIDANPHNQSPIKLSIAWTFHGFHLKMNDIKDLRIRPDRMECNKNAPFHVHVTLRWGVALLGGKSPRQSLEVCLGHMKPKPSIPEQFYKWCNWFNTSVHKAILYIKLLVWKHCHLKLELQYMQKGRNSQQVALRGFEGSHVWKTHHKCKLPNWASQSGHAVL